ncbi:MAG: ImmA/IrrE family metallo-endopeptidase [Lachnospiraceae bacterium]|nr:ImmA/IrrE family metallo-endopeptidase [Lachnospiraceae bacterium]
MNYELLLMESDRNNIITKEKPLRLHDGRIKGNKILIRSDMSIIRKSCVLAEELGHYYTTVGNILDQTDEGNRKQELRARLWAYNKLIGLDGIIRAYENGCTSPYETAEYLEVTEDFLSETLQTYKSKYGDGIEFGKYKISFNPTLEVLPK